MELVIKQQISIPEELYVLSGKLPHELYIVGGFCRDYFLGEKSGDIDLCGFSDIDEVTEVGKDCKIIPVNRHTGTFLICINGVNYEYTPFRSEEYSGGEHTPHTVRLKVQLRDDAHRRDFTCNAIYYCVNNSEFIDFFGGIEDIQNKTIRVIDYEKTLKNDGLRILRSIRFALRTGFRIEECTLKAIRQNIGNLKEISGERILTELELIGGSLKSDEDRINALKLFQQTGALNVIFDAAECDFGCYVFSSKFNNFVVGICLDYILGAFIKDVLRAGNDALTLDGAYNRIDKRLSAAAGRLKLPNGLRTILRKTIESGLKILCYPDAVLIKLAAAEYYGYAVYTTEFLQAVESITDGAKLGSILQNYHKALDEINCGNLCTDINKLALDGSGIQNACPEMAVEETGNVKKALLKYCLINNISNEKDRLLEVLRRITEEENSD